MTFTDLGLAEPILRALAEEGYTEPTADPGAGRSRRVSGPRPRRYRADRHRQDGGVRAADPQPPGGERRGVRRRKLPRPRALADARTRRADRRELPHLWPLPQAELDARLRRRADRQADARAAARRRHPGRHARPAARPAQRSRAVRSTRSRSSSSTRPTTCSTWASSTTSEAIVALLPQAAPDAVLLRHHAAGDRSDSPRDAPNDPAKVAVTPAAIDRRARRAARDPRRSTPASRTCCRAAVATRRSSACSSSPAPSTAPTASCDSSSRPASLPTRIHGNKSQGQRERALAGFRRARRACWSPPTSPRAASTSTTSPTSSTSTCRNVARKLRPPHRPHRARRHRGIAISFCAPDELSFLRAIERAIRQQIPATASARSVAPAAGAPIPTDAERPERRGSSPASQRGRGPAGSGRAAPEPAGPRPPGRGPQRPGSAGTGPSRQAGLPMASRARTARHLHVITTATTSVRSVSSASRAGRRPPRPSRTVERSSHGQGRAA